MGAGVYYANDGTAGAPAFAFNNDHSSGMYLPSVGQLGLSAGGTELLNLDNTNPLDPQITSPASFNAEGGIFGGTFS